MSWLIKAIAPGITAFAATNIDDIIILMLFFSQVNSSFRRRHIIVGQYLGFTALLIASLPGYFAGLIISKAWIGILGLVPIAIGIKSLFERDKNDSEIQTVSSQFQSVDPNKPTSIFATLIDSQTYNVAAVTIANGGDNIGIYVPLFASSNLPSLSAILIVFLILVGIWCYIAYRLTRQRNIAKVLTRYGSAFTPFILIGLGIFIVLENGTFQLLNKLPFLN